MTRTDDELLALAAKAVGIDGTKPWNPLTDDGDALRLAVSMGMLFTYMTDRFEMFQRFYRQELDNDLRPSAAARRAIVRVAAVIAEQMP